jgi:hypothetical protein
VIDVAQHAGAKACCLDRAAIEITVQRVIYVVVPLAASTEEQYILISRKH